MRARARDVRRACKPGKMGELELARTDAASPRGRGLRGFEMNGECAAVAHHDDWEDEVTGAVRVAFGTTAHSNCPGHFDHTLPALAVSVL